MRTTVQRIAVGLALLAGAWLAVPAAGPVAAAGGSGAWTTVGSLHQGRINHTLTTLPNGRVLAVGGQHADPDASPTTPLASAELFQPATGTWVKTGKLHVARTLHTATLLQNGKVLIVGGFTGDPAGTATRSAELYDPTTGRFTLTGQLTGARGGHTATLLKNGDVLIAGGLTAAYGSTFRSSVEIYHPASGTFRVALPMQTPRAYASATRLADGTVLVAGGETPARNPDVRAELYLPQTGHWQATGSLKWGVTPGSGLLLPSGKVLLTGKQYGDFPSGPELYDPRRGTFAVTRPVPLATPSSVEVLGPPLQLPGARVFAMGSDSAFLYSPIHDTWTRAASPAHPHQTATFARLHDGRILSAGGESYGSADAAIFRRPAQ
ncbi:MAG: hypothetical protein JO291_11115 [Acidimicrobiia bacterium]|nr:hypothetical protein [Acidimicrobiia bacterium]